MKNFYLLIFISTILFSCSKDQSSEEILQVVNAETYLLNSDPTFMCNAPSTLPQTNDVQIAFNEPLPYPANLSFSVKVMDANGVFHTTISFWDSFLVPAGANYATLNTSCELPFLVSCDGSASYPQTVSQSFKITLENAQYVGEGAGVPFELEPDMGMNGKNYYIVQAYKKCDGTIWDGKDNGLGGI